MQDARADRPSRPWHWQFRSQLPAMVWPAIPNGNAANTLALLHQLESSQWLPAEALQQRQFSQLELLLRHAWEQSPYCREAWKGLYDPDAPLTPERFAALPLLSRRDLQTHFQKLACRAVPPHGGVGEASTSGSTGLPVRVLKTELCLFLWDEIGRAHV